MGGFVDFFRMVWRWWSSPAVTQPEPIRKLSLIGRDETALSLAGRIETALTLTGSIAVSRLPQSLSCVYGEAVEITLTMDAPPAGGASGWTLGFWLRKDTLTGSLVVVTKTSGSGITLVDATAGIWTVLLSSADTKQVTGTYLFDLWRTDAGDETALAQGRFSIGDTVRP
jgi:hypothetical protein